MDACAAIGLDWGTTSLRAYLFDARGQVLERREAPCGVQAIRDGRFREPFEALCSQWLAGEPGLPVIACGMIGSRQGWREAPYAPTPAGFAELAAAVVPIDGLAGRKFRIIPGVSTVNRASPLSDDSGTHDVIRGEETQVFGALSSLGAADALIVLPGTHSKWVRVRERRIVAFRTYMTGELYAVLARHSILGRLFAPEQAPEQAPERAPERAQRGQDAAAPAFADGLARAAADPAGITALLFSVRAEALFDRYRPEALPAYLSGLLIGTEIAHAAASFAAPEGKAPLVAIVGSDELVRRYSIALAHAGLDATPVPGVPAADGLFALARAAGLVR
jgi:2-dehydro-3-deoxygalactonokinase